MRHKADWQGHIQTIRGRTMTKWLKRLRSAMVMGLTWAVGWALFGILIGVSSLLFPALPWDAFFAVFDAPLPALAVPGFVGGALFSLVLGLAERQRRFEQLSMRRFAAWGAVGGVLLSLVPATLQLLGLASTPDGGMGAGPLTALIVVPFSVLGAASAAGSLWLARRAKGDGVGDGGASNGALAASADLRPALGEGDRSFDRAARERREQSTKVR